MPGTLAVLIVVAALAEGLVAGLGAMAWSDHRAGGFTTEEALPFVVAGVSAAAGVVFAVLAMIALLRGRSGRGLARAAVNLSWLRLGAVIIALATVALNASVTSAFPLVGMVLAVGDGIGGLVVTGAAARRTSDG
ncbi:hypothetical protein Aph02nite_88060 [Actinoplanes philippinensis]|uniref:ATP synthase protein I n=1 Tax=Actinoplanes philippinensis TaxID=35752 RepID=A0A1I2MZ28_9ACTN|nr:hypothetical protein [Actinoplanes philippinensis]GIE82856.1 hypothetical protein Aph02nite_88060 [Actinoplanes philippinensis]SFF96854.1 hypothetical protein SAMN05421541_13639 [Actinoplanes philippinensis]